MDENGLDIVTSPSPFSIERTIFQIHYRLRNKVPDNEFSQIKKGNQKTGSLCEKERATAAYIPTGPSPNHS